MSYIAQQRTCSKLMLRKVAVSGSLAIVAGTVLLGCSSHPRIPESVRPTTTVTAVLPNPEEAVLAGYSNAIQAITDAEVHSDPNWPALVQTMVNPELAHVQAFIKTSRDLGYSNTGTAQIVRSKVSAMSSISAVVDACLFDSVIAHQADGAPVSGDAGRATYSIEKATLIPTGKAWVLQDGTAQQFLTADAAGSQCAP
jgi:hypothetical protein